MKTLAILALSAMTALTANCQLHFTNGMEWKTLLSGTTDPTPTTALETVTLEGDTTVNGFKAMKMYIQTDYKDHPSEKELAAAIRTEGEKVYFFHDSENPEWLLLYDFGLKPGEGCYVHYLPTGSNKTPFRSYVKCVSLGKDEDSGWDTLALEEYMTDACEGAPAHGTWIKGLGSENGVLWNSRFESDGCSATLLLEASFEGKVIYKKKNAGISEVADTDLCIQTDGLDVMVSGADGATVALYSDNGTLTGNFRTKEGKARITLPRKGIYILRAGDKSRKIMAM